ncbi:hemolysin family protein [Bacillus cereus]|uniref:hemolysin family protein n=1 Tax=Bacillus cereus TaxID=1396 RepID=UPI003980BB5B
MFSLILLVFLFLLSSFFASAETALASVNQVRLKKFVNEGRRGSDKALYLTKPENFDKSLSSILVGNNIVNIAAASISTKLLTDIFGGNIGVWISTVVMSILILIFGEIIPKSLAKNHAESYSLAISNVIYVLNKLLAPINSLLLSSKILFTKLFSNNNKLPSITEEEIKLIINMGKEEGVIDAVESQLIHRSMNLDEISLKEILTPRVDIVAIDITLTTEEITKVFFKERFSRILVYEKSMDNIIGFLSKKEFLSHLLKYKEINIKDLLREPLYVTESMKASALLPRLQKDKMRMAIVLNEFGVTIGLVTLEDILEMIVGEILDENEGSKKLVSQINENVYIFDAQYPLRDFAELMHVSLPKSAYFVLGGWILEKLEAIPLKGDSFYYEKLKISVDEVVERRVRKIKVEIQGNEVAHKNSSEE